MRDCRNSLFDGLLLLFCLTVLEVSLVHAESDDLESKIRNIRVELQDDLYVLSAELSFALSSDAKEALLKGIPLTWTMPISVKQKRGLLWDKEIYRFKLGYQMRYYALLNNYRVKVDQSAQVSNFTSLTAALNFMSAMDFVPLLNKTRLKGGYDYYVEFRIEFMQEALPHPLWPTTLFDPQWSLSSDWYQCSLPK